MPHQGAPFIQLVDRHEATDTGMYGDGAPSFAQLFVSTLVLFRLPILVYGRCWVVVVWFLVPGCCGSFYSPSKTCVYMYLYVCMKVVVVVEHNVLGGHSSRCGGRCNTFLLSCFRLFSSCSISLLIGSLV